MKATKNRGVSMVESLVATTIVALATAAAGWSFAPWIDRLRVESVAAAIETDLQLARSMAVARSQPVRFELRRQGERVCYVIHDGASGDCPCEQQSVAGAPPACRAGVSLLRASHLPTDRGLRASATASSLVFEPVHGVVTPTTTIDLEANQRPLVRLVVNVMGRIRSCAVSSPVPGLVSC